jgi:hypothetical protein
VKKKEVDCEMYSGTSLRLEMPRGARILSFSEPQAQLLGNSKVSLFSVIRVTALTVTSATAAVN